MQSRHIVITGVTRGLGRALVDRFIEAGHAVSGCGRSGMGISDLAKSHPAPNDFSSLDINDESDVTKWAENRIEAKGPPDLLINNAGIINTCAPLWDVPAEEFKEVMETNVGGTFTVIRAFLPAMIERGGGIVVNFSSGWGRGVSPDVAPYCASKWAIEGMTRALALELPRGLAAVALNPGIIDTEMLRSCWQDAAGGYPGPEPWSRAAAPFLLDLGTESNGRALTVPGF